MRPLELTIEGLRSFRVPVTLDLRGRDQIAIVGDTGAGKSSIIEAITYALYGQATFSGLNRELMNDAASQLRVVLRFRVAGQEWEVVRTLRRRGSGAVSAEPPQLTLFGAEGAPVERVTQARQVNERIEQVIGLNRDAFLRTTVLPQGRFAQLLVEDEPRARSTILRQVWRTDELEEAARIAADANAELGELRARLDQAAAAWPEDPPSHLAQLQRQANHTQRVAATAAQTERTASDAMQALTAAGEQRRRANTVTQRLDGFQPAVLIETVAPLSAVAAQIDRQESELRKGQVTLNEELAAVPADDDGPTAAGVTAALTALARIPALVHEAKEADGQSREWRATAERARVEAAKAEDAVRHAREQLMAGQSRGRELDRERQAAEQQRERAAERYDAAHRALEEAQAAQDGLTRYDGLLREARVRLREAESAVERLRRAETAAREHLQGAQRSQAAAVAADPLHPGDECPICKALLARIGSGRRASIWIRQRGRQARPPAPPTTHARPVPGRSQALSWLNARCRKPRSGCKATSKQPPTRAPN